jgi:hypothetical protein
VHASADSSENLVLQSSWLHVGLKLCICIVYAHALGLSTQPILVEPSEVQNTSALNYLANIRLTLTQL